MERSINRRDFLKIAGLTVVSTIVLGADITYGARIGQEKNPLSPEIMENLSLQAEQITSHISFRGFEQAKNLQASGYKLIPKPEKFAHMFLTMAPTTKRVKRA